MAAKSKTPTVIELTIETISTVPLRFPFTDVLICNSAGKPIGVRSRLYVEMLIPDSTWFQAVPVTKWPDYRQHMYRGYILTLRQPASPATLIETIDLWSNFLAGLQHEAYLLSCAEVMTEPIRAMLRTRLQSFLELLKLNNFDGPIPIWNPELYGGTPGVTLGVTPLDSIGEQIQAHMLAQTLPMTQINPVPAADAGILLEILNLIQPAPPLLALLEQSHFVTALKGSQYLTDRGLATLMADEFRWVKTGAPIDSSGPFIFDASTLDSLGVTLPMAAAYQHLKAYVGTYLDDLDLSQSFITGSAITAALVRTGVDSYYENRADQMEILYPILLTSLPAEDQERLRRDDLRTWTITILDAERGNLTKGDQTILFRFRPGSDVDLAVDTTAELATVARKHFETVRKHYPFVKFKTIVKPNGSSNYSIYTDDPAHLPTFRPIEIYQSSFRQICTHHVGCVRGAYTSFWTASPQFYLTASAVWTSKHRQTPNYHYFAGKKSSPQEIILKNRIRGIGIEDPVFNQIFETYREQNGIKISPLPFHGGQNIPSSIFAARTERPYFVRNLATLRSKIETLRTNFKLKHVQAQADLLDALTAILGADNDSQGLRDQLQALLKQEQANELAQLDRQEAILDRFLQ